MKKVPARLPGLQGLLARLEFFIRGNYAPQQRARQGGQRKEGSGRWCPSQDVPHIYEGLGPGPLLSDVFKNILFCQTLAEQMVWLLGLLRLYKIH